MDRGQGSVTGNLVLSADDTHLFQRPRTFAYLFLVCIRNQSEDWFIRQPYPPAV